MPYSADKGTTRSVLLFAEQEAKRLDLTIKVTLPGPQYHSMSMSAPPVIPYDLLDTLWSNGLCQGVHEAYGRSDFSLNTSCIEVEFLHLAIPADLEALDDSQLEELRSTLQSMV